MPLNINKIARMDRRAEPRLRDDLACFFMEFSCGVELARWRLGPCSYGTRSDQAAGPVPVSHITFSSLSNSQPESGRRSDRSCATIFLAIARQSFSFGLFNS